MTFKEAKGIVMMRELSETSRLESELISVLKETQD